MALSVSRITVAAVLVLDREGVIREARICPGAVMPMPTRMHPAEDTLIGFRPDAGIFPKAGQRAAEEMLRVTGVRSSTSYKKPVLAGLIEQALSTAAERCRRHED
jgi:CO/xanthine dehydrogenase FAD-binding subunit